ncbi:unnamed protein product, partial [marine sediment metagenome]
WDYYSVEIKKLKIKVESKIIEDSAKAKHLERVIK